MVRGEVNETDLDRFPDKRYDVIEETLEISLVICCLPVSGTVSSFLHNTIPDVYRNRRSIDDVILRPSKSM